MKGSPLPPPLFPPFPSVKKISNLTIASTLRSAFAFLLLAFAAHARAGAGAFQLTSPAFTQGALIPTRYTCEGRNLSPPLEISGIPAGTRSLVLIVDDPDAPGGTFTHWLLWNIPPATARIPAGAPPAGSLQGINDFGTAGYSGPCPPEGTHRYFFHLSALSATLPLPAGASREQLEAAIRAHLLATAELMARYAKTGTR